MKHYVIKINELMITFSWSWGAIAAAAAARGLLPGRGDDTALGDAPPIWGEAEPGGPILEF